MKDVYPSTQSEDKLIKAIQSQIGAYANGVIGCQTLSDIAVRLGADCFPITLSLYGYPTIIAKNIIPFNPKGAIKSYSNTMLGSFTHPRATAPCSILINNGKVINFSACHAFLDKPETVIYKLYDGSIGIAKARYSSELPSDVLWAVGGMGLGTEYNPSEEGFTGNYADVLRKTNHNVLAVKNGMMYGVYYKNMTGQQIQEHVTNKMKFEKAILLDGGGLAAINGAEKFAQINTGCVQGYAIQFI